MRLGQRSVLRELIEYWYGWQLECTVNRSCRICPTNSFVLPATEHYWLDCMWQVIASKLPTYCYWPGYPQYHHGSGIELSFASKERSWLIICNPYLSPAHTFSTGGSTFSIVLPNCQYGTCKDVSIVSSGTWSFCHWKSNSGSIGQSWISVRKSCCVDSSWDGVCCHELPDEYARSFDCCKSCEISNGPV